MGRYVTQFGSPVEVPDDEAEKYLAVGFLRPVEDEKPRRRTQKPEANDK